MNLFHPKVGDQADINVLTQKGKLNSGKELSYALGIAVDTYKGWKQYSHGGADAGYRTYISVLPDLKMGFIVFSNLADFDAGGRCYDIANLFVKDTSTKKPAVKTPQRDSSTAVLKDTLAVKKFLGYYMGDDGLPFSFTIKDRKLYYHVYDESSFLIRESKDTFSVFSSPEIKFAFGIKGKDTTVDAITPNQTYHLNKFTKDSSSKVEILQPYTGTYYCPELDCKYTIFLKDSLLYLGNSKYNDSKLTLSGKDHLNSGDWWINHLVILRDAKNRITGFEVNSGRIMHLKFNKIE
jgi:hypothetical protein